MIYALLVVLTCIVAALAVANFRLPAPATAAGTWAHAKRAPARAAVKRAPAPTPKPRAAAAASAPERRAVVPGLTLDASPLPAAPSLVTEETTAFVPTPFAGNDAERKIRDRYISLRFPGVAASSFDLVESERVIKAARLYFEERKTDRALELLELAIEQSAGDESLRLAQLEIAFLGRDARLYCALARDFQSSHPASSQLEEVARLGRALAPSEPMFGDSQPEQAHDHYGPWPNTPNWIQATWDLTAEILGADHHRALKVLMQAAA